jgi:Mor family transcriptional regulator
MTDAAREMVDVAEAALGNHAQAVKVVRAILRYFGGQLIYLPLSADHIGSKVLDDLRGVVADEIGDGDADRLLGPWSKMFGGMQLYMPLEASAFRDEIADEIYARYNGTTGCMADLCREYRTSYVQIYRLYHRGRERKTARQADLFEAAGKQ